MTLTSPLSTLRTPKRHRDWALGNEHRQAHVALNAFAGAGGGILAAWRFNQASDGGVTVLTSAASPGTLVVNSTPVAGSFTFPPAAEAVVLRMTAAFSLDNAGTAIFYAKVNGTIVDHAAPWSQNGATVHSNLPISAAFVITGTPGATVNWEIGAALFLGGGGNPDVVASLGPDNQAIVVEAAPVTTYTAVAC